MAQMDITSTRHHGALRIGSAFWKAEPSEQRYVLAHERVHLHLRRLRTIVEGTEAALGANAFSMLSHSFNIAEEYATDALHVGDRQPVQAPQVKIILVIALVVVLSIIGMHGAPAQPTVLSRPTWTGATSARGHAPGSTSPTPTIGCVTGERRPCERHGRRELLPALPASIVRHKLNGRR